MIRSTTLAFLLTGAALPALANDGVLDVVGGFELKGPDPILSGNIFLNMEVVETLVDVDAGGRLRPGLATGWAVSEDGLIWTFTLREGVVFHDGTPLEAAAVAASLERSRTAGGLLGKTPITEIRAAGDLTVEFVMSEPFGILPAMLVEYRSAVIAPASFAEDGTVSGLIGTGAYRITELAAPTKMSLEGFNDYWGGAPAIGKAAYHAASRAETRALMAESGDADITLSLDPASVSRLKDASGLSIGSAPTPRVLMMKLNGEVFDADTRKALSLAIDRNGIARAVLRYPAGATQMFPPGMAEWHDTGLDPLTYDPEAAKAVLAGSGWTAGADGVLAKDGKRLEIEILTFPDRPELPLIAAVMEQQFAAIGASATINSTSYSEIPARHKDGTLSTALYARNFALVPNPVGTLLQDYAPGGDWGAMGWSNEDFTAGVKAMAAGEATNVTREDLVATLQGELPVLPIAWYQLNMAISNTVEGVVVDPFERNLGLASVKWAAE